MLVTIFQITKLDDLAWILKKGEFIFFPELLNSGKLEEMANFHSLVSLRNKQRISVSWVYFDYGAHASIL